MFTASYELNFYVQFRLFFAFKVLGTVFRTTQTIEKLLQLFALRRTSLLMCSTCKQRKLTVKPVVSKQVFDVIKFPLFVGANKKFGIDRSKAQRK